MPIEKNELSANAKGGTELMLERLRSSLGDEFLADFQIIPSRVRNLDENKIRVLWCHDLPQDPESHHLANEGWRKFHKIIFVSNWQAQRYIEMYNIPWSKTLVLMNAITPFKDEEIIKSIPSQDQRINLIYHTTPHRGLNILVPVFKKLAEKYDDIHLDVYSSFDIYGWPERNKPFQPLFDEISNHPQMTYYGFKPHAEVMAALAKADIFAYPSTWIETSCISLMEAMSAKCICVHPNYGALYETAANWTLMYDWQEDQMQHAGKFYSALDAAISIKKAGNASDLETKVENQKRYADLFYNWESRAAQWKVVLDSLRNEPRGLPQKTFSYIVR